MLVAYSGLSWLYMPLQTQEGGHCLSPNVLKNPFSLRCSRGSGGPPRDSGGPFGSSEAWCLDLEPS